MQTSYRPCGQVHEASFASPFGSPVEKVGRDTELWIERGDTAHLEPERPLLFGGSTIQNMCLFSISRKEVKWVLGVDEDFTLPAMS